MCANSRPIMNASRGPAGASSRSHSARAPGTEISLGRSFTSGRAKIRRANSSTAVRSGFCSSCVRGLVGVVLGGGPLLSGRAFQSIYLPPSGEFEEQDVRVRQRPKLQQAHVFHRCAVSGRKPGPVQLDLAGDHVYPRPEPVAQLVRRLVARPE